ncbi:LLM class flavin-dependent oxidoreductase [Rhizorhabdus argentea]|uniref:LLM class flavin-dependent oxidoreductase n=1 Tax=Rhizorhabdus argentea TaxID=1387174 RepID=UPI0030EB6FA6
MIDIGLTLDRTTNFLPANELAKLVTDIERFGFESVWLLDAFGRDPFLATAFILANTKTLKVATGVATVYGRDPFGAVQTLQTLSEFYPGRFIMGLGASNPIVIGKRGGEWVQPLPKMTSYLEGMAQTKLGMVSPAETAPVYIAAHAPGLQKLAMKQAQGIVTWMMPSPIIADARERVGPDLNITSEITCVLSTDAEEARRVARSYLAMYLALPYYQTAFVKAGFDVEECTAGGGSDRLIDSVLAWGSPADILKRVSEFERAGASRLVLNVLRAAPQKAAGDPIVATGDWQGLEGLGASIFPAN